MFASQLQLIRPSLWGGHPAWLLKWGGVAAAWLVARIWPSAAIADPSQLVKRGIAYQKKGQPLKALAFWRLAGDRGGADAFYRIGLLYARGEGVLCSPPDAVVWLRMAGENGHVEAQHQLGLLYLRGAPPHPSSRSVPGSGQFRFA